MVLAAASSVASHTRSSASKVVASTVSKKPSKNTISKDRNNSTKIPVAKKKKPQKKPVVKKKPQKKQPKKKPVRVATVDVATVPVATAHLEELPDILNPEDKNQLLEFFASYGVVAKRKMIYSIVDDEGVRHDLQKRHSSNMIRLMAAQVIHFS
jgi:hypothetical protein